MACQPKLVVPLTMSRPRVPLCISKGHWQLERDEAVERVRAGTLGTIAAGAHDYVYDIANTHLAGGATPRYSFRPTLSPSSTL